MKYYVLVLLYDTWDNGINFKVLMVDMGWILKWLFELFKMWNIREMVDVERTCMCEDKYCKTDLFVCINMYRYIGTP